MTPLARKIARAIAMDGPIPIGTFMTMALHDPEYGFYAARQPIGAHATFITAPEISQMFGEFIGLWSAQVWRDQGQPRRARLIELGPGRGTLMRDALRALRRVPDFLDRLEITLVEASPALAASQREQLHASHVPITWVRQWTEIPDDWPMFLFANEFLDALPLRQFVKTERGWCERMVATDAAGGLAFALAPVPTSLAVPTRRGPAERGAVYEISPAGEALAEDIGRVIVKRGGAALFIDYGHEGNGYGDTLQAVSHHKPAEILAAPGEADISAHVDFAALASAAQQSGARTHGPVAQSAFLHALGIEARADHLVAANPERAEEIAAAVNRLTDTKDMGALFKVLAVTPRDAPEPPGL
jgi:NADH dehydrogenase [ubiquinone] 1 alpha subcomplex assembly factor 7